MVLARPVISPQRIPVNAAVITITCAGRPPRRWIRSAMARTWSLAGIGRLAACRRSTHWLVMGTGFGHAQALNRVDGDHAFLDRRGQQQRHEGDDAADAGQAVADAQADRPLLDRATPDLIEGQLPEGVQDVVVEVVVVLGLGTG